MPKRFRLTLHEGTCGLALREAPMGHFAPTAAQKLVIEFNRRFGLGNGALRKYGCSLVEMSRAGPLDYEYFGLRLRFFPPLRFVVGPMTVVGPLQTWRQLAALVR
jgi:hypothetical protein